MSGPVPDLKRNVSPPIPGSECCDCCEGIEAQTPQAIDNPVGLSRIAYRVGDHAQFRASLHAALSSSEFGSPPGTSSPLANLLTRDPDDFTIGLIDAFACSADLLTFYQERIATESYLLTALERVSVQEMGKLVGYELKPGLAAETWLAFALETPPVPPADLPPEPGNFVTGVPSSLRLEAGLKVQSVPGPDEKPQTFELVETLEEARPEWNAIRPWLSETRYPAPGDTEVWLAAPDTPLQPGDGLLFLGQGFLNGTHPSQWQFRPAGIVEAADAEGRARVAWTLPLGAALTPATPAHPTLVYVLRRRSGVFGNSAPNWAAMTPQFRTDYETLVGALSADGTWPKFTISTVVPDDTTGGAVDLDSLQQVVADVPGDPSGLSFAVLARDNFQTLGLYRVNAVSEVSRGDFGIAAKVTRLGLVGANLKTGFDKFVRDTSVYARSELLLLAQRPVPDPVGGKRIPVNADAAEMANRRRLIVRGTSNLVGGGDVTVEAVLVAVHSVGPGRAEIEIESPLAAPLRRDSVVVHANVALASHGESVSQILGSGVASEPFQRFELKQLPLTYRAAGGTGATAELVVRVGDIAWRERASLFDAGPTERAYTLDVDEQGRTFVASGDGVRGARLPSGTNNLVARYRRGLGTSGNVAADTLTQLMSRPLGLKSVSNPLPAEGGADPEGAEAARGAIRRATRTLGRVVSVVDYEDFALAYTGIAKAQARVLNLRAGPTIAIALAPPEGTQLTPTGPVATGLLAALKAGGDPHVAVALLPYLDSHFQIGIRVRSAEDYESATVLAAVEAALRSAFSFERRDLGQPVHQSEAISVAQAVPGVVAVDLTLLYGGTEPGGQMLPSLQKRLLAKRMHVASGAAQPAELLTLDSGPLALLEEMP